MNANQMRAAGLTVMPLAYGTFEEVSLTVSLAELNMYDLDRHIVACRAAIARLEQILRKAEREVERREAVEDKAWGTSVKPTTLNG